MNIKLIRNISIVLVSIVGVIYLLFLILPLILSPVLENYVPQINEEFKKATGLVTDIKNIKVVTTPKLTVGAKVGKFAILTPDNKTILNADDFQVKMSLLPILAKKVEVDLVRLENLDLNLGINKDGSFEIEKYFPAHTDDLKKENEDNEENPSYLPFGLKLSNKLPDIRIGGYNVKFTDTSNGREYLIKGNKTDITDFILNKSVKIYADGNITLAGREQFKYNVKIHNKIMPEIDLNEAVFNPQPNEEKDKNKDEFKINLSEIFKGLYDYKITANLDGNLNLNKESQDGYINLTNLSVSPGGMNIPASSTNLIFKGNKININSDIYTAQNEKSTVAGTVATGKNTKIDLNVKSGAELSNLVRIINAFALTFNIKDLQTLSANGKINADFNIKSDLKKIDSNGYLKIPYAKIRYGLYDITIDKINADIALDNNNVNIKNLGFTILNQPLKLYGFIKQDASADLHLTADNLSLKGLIIACGQAVLLKDNQINSGLVSLKADIVGKLDKIKPTAKVILSNVNIKNIPANTVLILPNTNIDIIADGQTFSGTANSTNIKAVNPAATVNIPKMSAKINEKNIEITQTPVNVEKIKFNVYGNIKNYMSEKINVDFTTAGDIKSKLTGEINAVKQTLNLAYATTQNSTIVIPLFDKSKMIFNSDLAITGSMANPQLSGTVNVPSINMPEIPVTIINLTSKLHGDILNGSATAEKFISGGIEANNITTDFSMKGENFYLKNVKGNAFDGKFDGNIIYNMSNAKTAVDFNGQGMNAGKAIEGAAGIKKALTGTLSFNTKLNLNVVPEYNDMMRSLKGNLSFKIDKGAFGSIGRLENLLCANNILGNAVFKTTVASFSNIAAVKDSAIFEYISGDMSFSDGWANISNIKSSGKTLAYFIEGKYNLINASANVTILGRMDGAIVKLLGPIGDLSVEKILSNIPKLGNFTAKYAEAMATDPDKERVKDIPKLSNSSEIYKDFKVVFNGGLESTSSVKSFKWLSKVDTSAIQQQTVTDSIKSIKSNVNTDVNATVQSVKDVVDSVKTQKEQLKESVDELKNLFKF